MLIIRKDQEELFAKREEDRFVSSMLTHLQEFFPEESASAGESGLRKLIDSGIQRSAAYSILAERDVCQYIDLMCVLGAGFDTDESLPWAQEILTREGYPSQKVQELIEAAQGFLEEA